ncbi:MAG TPA: S6e family ribosomal protein [Nitrososphaeraceae archaeon]|nr:S6e family ribosomal protein [Nitrososphaeraceae archaeon]
MPQFKLVISDINGKSITQELKDRTAQPLLGSKIGDIIDSAVIGISGGRMKITGGSDKSGTPMRPDVHGGVKKYVLLSRGIGMKNTRKGNRIRKLVRGKMVTEEIYQLNCLLVEGILPVKAEVSDNKEPTKNKEQ